MFRQWGQIQENGHHYRSNDSSNSKSIAIDESARKWWCHKINSVKQRSHKSHFKCLRVEIFGKSMEHFSKIIDHAINQKIYQEGGENHNPRITAVWWYGYNQKAFFFLLFLIRSSKKINRLELWYPLDFKSSLFAIVLQYGR